MVGGSGYRNETTQAIAYCNIRMYICMYVVVQIMMLWYTGLYVCTVLQCCPQTPHLNGLVEVLTYVAYLATYISACVANSQISF